MKTQAKQHTRIWMLTASATIAAAIGALALGGNASAATDSAGEAPTRDRGDRVAVVCEHLDDIEARMASHLDQIATRQSWLATRRAEAVGAGHDRVVERLDRAADRLTERAAQVQGRIDRLATWAADHCDAA